MEVNGKLHAAAELFIVKEPLFPLDRWQGGSRRRPERCAEEENLLSRPDIEIRILGRPVGTLVTIPTESSRIQ
jgi:hypothetical protein